MIKAIYKSNEVKTNEVCTRAVKVLMLFVLLVAVLCWTQVFDVHPHLVNVLIVTVAIPLIIPVILIDLMHIEGSWVKYVILSCIVMVTVMAYVIFTFQAVILFVIPSILGAMYLDKKVSIFTAVLTSLGIVVAHIITGFILFQPWIEPFTDRWAMLMYGAVPRVLQYLCCAGLLHIMSERFISFLEGFDYVLNEANTPKETNTFKEEIPCESKQEENDLQKVLTLLTEREGDVFKLIIKGYTNAQIANELCLSVGTVKNYVSLIYDKVGIRNRTALVLKYSPFEGDCD